MSAFRHSQVFVEIIATFKTFPGDWEGISKPGILLSLVGLFCLDGCLGRRLLVRAGSENELREVCQVAWRKTKTIYSKFSYMISCDQDFSVTVADIMGSEICKVAKCVVEINRVSAADRGEIALFRYGN